jgi:hypothetical protein
VGARVGWIDSPGKAPENRAITLRGGRRGHGSYRQATRTARRIACSAA